MGGNGSTARKVSFGLSEDEKVTVIEGVKLSEDVLRRMKEAQGSDTAKPPPPEPNNNKQPLTPEKAHPATTEIQEEMLRNFVHQQELVQEQLARLAEREREVAATTGLNEMIPEMVIERGKAQEEKEKAKVLPADLDAWARQLESKEKELSSISSFYKEQLETLEKKNLDNYKQCTELYNEAATKAEAHIRPRFSAPVCTELQAKVFECYRQNAQQTLHCSNLAKQYMNCVQQAKKSTQMNHG